jgi:hypothetical protein
MSLEYHEVLLLFIFFLIFELADHVVLEGVDHALLGGELGRAAELLLELLLLELLELELLLVVLLDGRGEDLCVVVGRVEGTLGVLLDPEVLRRLEVVSEDRNDFLDLFISVLIDEEHELALPFMGVQQQVLVLQTPLLQLRLLPFLLQLLSRCRCQPQTLVVAFGWSICDVQTSVILLVMMLVHLEYKAHVIRGPTQEGEDIRWLLTGFKAPVACGDPRE